ncbi:MAG: hypothetical protein AAB658_16550, partial [Chloroflexota bacterium]
MTMQSIPPPELEEEPHVASWALPVSKLKTEDIPREAVNLNVDGRRLTGPLKGFGQMWQKTYSVRLPGVKQSPAEVINAWKKNFGSFWSKGNRFYGSVIGIAPGEVALLNLAGPGGLTGPGGAPLISTGVLVIYADDISFSFMTPEGHMFAGMITFSAADEEGGPVAQIQVLIRANDPIYELGCRLGVVHKTEDVHWHTTLTNLATHLGAQNINIEQKNTLVDPRVQWSEARNIWHNAALRTARARALMRQFRH